MIVCLVTDRRQLRPDARTARDEVTGLAGWLEEAVGAGVDLIQLRERDLPGRLLTDLARAVMASAAGSKTQVVMNDRIDVAMARGCDGVHLRSDGPPVDRVRALAARRGSGGRDHLIGRSIHSIPEARTHGAADYLIFGAVFDSGEKRGLGLGALREAAGVDSAPRMIAIGGITVGNAGECIAAGAAGVAAIRMFLPKGRAPDALGISEATRQLRGVQ